ncbi:ATP-binding protein [Desulfovibrio sp. JC010]|uniref:ATP-binding protein n=1 Tax=Desulfovibrio sp. JC010 TaxID=2593641 RepID=UPI0013D5A7CC|nr:ATP-binding protein [Desulfovibrio sp. JC010]
MNKQLFMNRRFSADLKNLSISAEMVRQCRAVLSMDKKTGQDIDLAVSEAVSNAIRHTGSPEDSSVVLRLISDGTRLIVEVEDSGPGFDFDQVQPPDLDIPQEGGYGLFLIRQVMDSASYERRQDCNVLTMEKQLAASLEASEEK